MGHLEAFDWNLLRPHMRNVEPFDARFDRLFAFGIDPVGGGLPSDFPSDWPSAAEIRAYNRRVRETLDEAEHDGLLLHMALEHRLMHAETLRTCCINCRLHHEARGDSGGGAGNRPAGR